MKIIFISIFFGTFICLASDHRQSIEVFVNVPASTPHPSSIYMTGNTSQICYWRVDCYRGEKVAEQTFRFLLKPNQNNKITFKITRGAWQSEAAMLSGEKLENFQLNLEGQHKRFIINIPHWKDLKPAYKTGKFIQHQNFYSPELKNTRHVEVRLPKNYDINQKKYPVIYFHDGQNAFDPHQSMQEVDWGIDESLARMATKNHIQQAIVVAVAATPDRNKEYNYLEKGHLHARFLIETLKPFIDQNYRTKPSREHTYVMGSSMGALISFALVYAHPDIFSKGVGLSFPAFAYDRFIFKFLDKTPVADSIKFFFDHGTVGGDANYQAAMDEFFLKLLDMMKGRKFHFKKKVFPYAAHSEIDWSRRLPHHLRFLLGGPM